MRTQASGVIDPLGQKISANMANGQLPYHTHSLYSFLVPPARLAATVCGLLLAIYVRVLKLEYIIRWGSSFAYTSPPANVTTSVVGCSDLECME